MASLCRLTNHNIGIHCLRSKCLTSEGTNSSFYLMKKSISQYVPMVTNSASKLESPPIISATKVQPFLRRCTGLYSISNNYYNLRPQQHQQTKQFRNYSSLQTPMQTQPTRLIKQTAMTPSKNSRNLSSKEVTKNMTLYTSSPLKCDIDQSTLQFKKPTGNPLVLMMSWLMAKQKHLKKYAEIYTNLGFDVIVIHITPWQLLWPTKGTQVVAAETLKFLENNNSYAPIVLHGFSVGAYQFGEIMLQMSKDMARYQAVLDRIACQIWDSAADITEIPEGLPKSIFPKNLRMQSALRNYTLYHLKTFHNQATIHYMRSSQMFHSTILKKPALFFVSENDLIGPPSSNNAVRENWERANITVTLKCWKRSMHAAHFIVHRDEYLKLLFAHLENSGVLEGTNELQRAKL